MMMSGTTSGTSTNRNKKRFRAIASLYILAVLSALFLWVGSNNDTEESYTQHYAEEDVQNVQRQLDISKTTDETHQQQQQCKDTVPPIFRQHTPSELKILNQVFKCRRGLPIPWTMDATIPMLDCSDNENKEDELMKMGTDQILTSIQSTIKKYQRIWFVGDSILTQQFNMLHCMLNPHPASGKLPTSKELRFVQFDHSSNSLVNFQRNSDNYHHDPSDFSITTLESVPVGYNYDSKERTLYETRFPSILREATEHDAIIIDGGAHYTHDRMHLMDKALRFIAEQSTKTNGTIYYMEPTPEEWKTSNGMYGKRTNGCEKLTEAAILGQEEQFSDEEVSCNADDEDCIEQSEAILQKLYPLLYPPKEEVVGVQQQSTSDNNNEAAVARPKKSPPATWRSDLSRSIYVDSNNGFEHKVNFVPVFWQLIKSGQKSNVRESDCTHKSLSAVFFMNFQLLRAIKDHEEEKITAVVDDVMHQQASE